MAEDTLTLVDEGRPCEIAARVNADSVVLSPDALATALGWEMKPQGLCKDDRCIRTEAYADLVNADGINLAALAEALERPLALDVEERIAYLGASANRRAAQLATLDAPAFRLPDLDGHLHALSDYRGKKVLLVAYASW